MTLLDARPSSSPPTPAPRPQVSPLLARLPCLLGSHRWSAPGLPVTVAALWHPTGRLLVMSDTCRRCGVRR